jgi:hypothetical protein
MLAALKTHIDLREALVIEALKCANGDGNYAYQFWYPKYLERARKQQAFAGTTGPLDALDPAKVAEELKMTRQAIVEHEEMLDAHRLAIIEDRLSPCSDEEIDEIHSVLDSLRRNVPALEAALRGELE